MLPALAGFVVLTRAFYVPYLEHYGSAYNSVEPWTNERTPLNIYLSLYGLLLLPVGAYLLLGVWRNYHFSRPRFLAGLAFGLMVVGVTLFLTALGVPVAAVALPLAALAFLAALMPGTGAQTRLLWLLTAGALLLTVFVELFTLKGDVGRMNTVFKFYIQAWLILGVTAGVLVVWTFERLAEADVLSAVGAQVVRLAVRPGFAVTLACLVFLAALYPAFALPAKMRDRYAADAPAGLDGMAYMTQAIRTEQHADKTSNFPLLDDYRAIKWVQDHVQGSPTILEGTTGPDLYRWGNRFAIYTGLPAVIGWQWHQRQQRAALDDRIVYDRDNDVATFYNTADIGEALQLLRRYDARYVVVGQVEHVYYSDRGLPKFAQMVQAGFLRIAYQNEGTIIYQVLPSADAQVR
jgi:YYY domain-containing protein